MAQFITRVELHGAVHGDGSYDILHKAMELKGFSRTILSSAGVVYHLPTAEYNMDSNSTIENVFNLANTAASFTQKKFAVFVSEIKTALWDGLPKV